MKYWLYDPDDGVTFFDDEDEFHKAAGGVEGVVESYHDPAEGWSEDVRGVRGGVITLRAAVEACLLCSPYEMLVVERLNGEECELAKAEQHGAAPGKCYLCGECAASLVDDACDTCRDGRDLP